MMYRIEAEDMVTDMEVDMVMGEATAMVVIMDIIQTIVHRNILVHEKHLLKSCLEKNSL